MTLVALGAPAGRDRWEVEHAGRRYAVFVADGDVVVTDALCPHRQGRLVEGVVRDGAVVCPSHWYAFELGTGQCRTTPLYTLEHYPVVDVDGVLHAEIPERAQRSWSEILRAHARGG